MNDETPMPFGKYKGAKMANVPASYLMYIFNNYKEMQKDLYDYIEENLDALTLEIENNEPKRD